jgi:hypothetical protein
VHLSVGGYEKWRTEGGDAAINAANQKSKPDE